MTKKEFINKIKKETTGDRLFNYIFGFTLITFGLFLFYKISFTNWYADGTMRAGNKMVKPVFIYFFLFSLLTLGSYTIIKTLKLCKTIDYMSNIKQISKNVVLLKLSVDKMLLIGDEENFMKFMHSSFFTNTHFIYIYYDGFEYSINVQNNSQVTVDFGKSKKIANQIIEKIKLLELENDTRKPEDFYQE